MEMNGDEIRDEEEYDDEYNEDEDSFYIEEDNDASDRSSESFELQESLNEFEQDDSDLENGVI